jgi:hypothetical protein
MKETVFIKEHGILFARAENGFLEPTHVNCEVDGDRFYGEEIVRGSFLFDFIMFIRFSERKKITSGKKNFGKFRDGFFEVYQWIIAIFMLFSISNMNADRIITVISRQAGKSFMARKILAFILVFYPKHFDLGVHDRFYVTFTSLKKETIEGQLLKLTPEIKKAIELYEMLYPNEYIEWKDTPTEKRVDKTLLKNKSVIQFNRVINGESLKYSQLDIISLNNKVVSAGLTSHVLFVDEMQNVDYNWLSKQAVPFLTSTSGVLVGIGTANNDANSALFNYYKSDAIEPENKIILDWTMVYEYKKLISEKHAEKYRRSVEKEIKEKGINSIVIQTEYYCNFNVGNDKFITMEGLRENNIMTTDFDSNISHYTDKNTYRIGSFDAAITGDRAIFGFGVGSFGETTTNMKLLNIEMLKDLNDSVDPDALADRVVELCKSNTLDYLIMDATAGQKYLVSSIYKKLKIETQTQLIPFDFSGFKEKVKMCQYTESLIVSQNIKIPKENYIYEETQYGKNLKNLIDELITLEKKENTNGQYSYKAPKNHHDDYAMMFFMFSYSLEYLLESINSNKEFKIGKYNHRLYKRKWEDNFITKKKINIVKNWIF